MAENVSEDAHDYSLLKDLRLQIGVEDSSFSLCFWVYLMNSTPFPATIIGQVHSDITGSAPFLVLNEKKKMMLLPLLYLHREALYPGNSTSWTEVPSASAEVDFPLKRWVHVGCEVATDFMRLHIDGKIVGEKPLSSLSNNESDSNGSGRVTLVGIGGDDAVQGYIHNAKILPLTFSIKDHYVQDPPLQLSIDSSTALDIEEDSDGVWSIVGGKASCRRNFSLDVILLDALGQPVNKEIEVDASLLYADNGEPVEKPNDSEAPLLTSYDGIEFSSSDRPSKLSNGRASFKLKISQLSSKCDNRLFHIKFSIPKIGTYPFLETISHSIRCISRNRNTRSSSLMCKRSSSVVHPLSGSQSSGLDDLSSDIQHSNLRELKPSPSLKRIKSGQEKSSATFMVDPTMDQPDEECNSHAWTSNQVNNVCQTHLEGRQENVEETENSSSHSESTEEGNPFFNNMSSYKNQISDLTIFKYCLGGNADRCLLLKEIASFASEQELEDFAQMVALYSGCSHHRCQIIITRKLIEEGTKAWNLISQNNHQVHWENVVFEIEELFMKIAHCSTRSLTHEDLELLRRISGCQEYLDRENFDKMWYWLYPVAFTLSRDWINATWCSASPKWIEGFVTKEEAESSLQGPRGLQQPGTFILRFPTSRSWPHPDAGSLIVTYIGSDYNLHHRMLSLDNIYSSDETVRNMKPLEDMLLAEPELSRLGRIIRNH